MKIILLLACLLFPAHSEPVQAQNNVSRERIHSESSVGVWFAHSPSSNSFFAKMKQTRFSLAGLDVTYAHLKAGRLMFHFSSQLIIYSKTDFPANGRSGPREDRNGVGITPLRITVPFTNRDSYPYISAGGGLMLFGRRFPNDEGTRLNATVDLGIGYNVDLGEKYRFDFGYRFHHLSNGNTGEANPGLDSNLFIATLQMKIPGN